MTSPDRPATAPASVPDVAGCSAHRATAILVAAGFEPTRSSDRFPAGRLNHSLKDSAVRGTFPPAGATLQPGATVDLLPTSPADAPSGRRVDERTPTEVLATDENGQDLTGIVPDVVGMFIISAEQLLGSRGIAYSTRVDTSCSEDQDGNVTDVEPAPGSFATYVTLWECFHPGPTDTGPPETI